MATQGTFDFDLGARIRLAGSNETGTVIGRAEYVDGNPTYLIRYQAGDSRLTEAWWAQSAIEITAAGQDSTSA